MEIRILLLKKFLLYRRNSYRFPSCPQMQFAVCLKLMLYEYKRHQWPLATSDDTKNHYSALILMDKLFNIHLEHMNNSFIKSEGWTVGSKIPNVFSYLFDSEQLNAIHFS